MVIVAGLLMKRVNHFNLLLVTTFLTLLSGIGMILTVQNVGFSSLWEVCYIASEIFDYVNNLTGFVILFSYLELESRAIVLSVSAVFIALWGALMTFMNG